MPAKKGLSRSWSWLVQAGLLAAVLVAGLAPAEARRTHAARQWQGQARPQRGSAVQASPAPAGCRLRFLGGAGVVGGSMYLLESGGRRMLVDCGLYQGRATRHLRTRQLPTEAVGADCMVLTHAHIDHSGNIPLLVKQGFTGKIHCTRTTADLCQAMLIDSAKVQMRKAEAARNGRRDGDGAQTEPLYTMRDAQQALRQLEPHDYGEVFSPTPGVRVCFSQAGHIPGAASAAVDVTINGQPRRIAFSGDIGRRGAMIVDDPQAPRAADYVVMESTYGNRTHAPAQNMKQQLWETIDATVRRGGKVVIPAFALQRTQQIVFLLNQLKREGRLNVPVYVDSPLGSKVTEVFRRHPESQGPEVRAFASRYGNPYAFSGLRLVSAAKESMALGSLQGPAVIISSPGMPHRVGRIIDHLSNNLADPRNTVAIVGYQAEGTMGRLLAQGQQQVTIHGRPQSVRAQVKVLDAFSAHADRNDLLWWAGSCGPQVRNYFLVHGDADQSQSLAGAMRQQGMQASVPAIGQAVELH